MTGETRWENLSWKEYNLYWASVYERHRGMKSRKTYCGCGRWNNHKSVLKKMRSAREMET